MRPFEYTDTDQGGSVQRRTSDSREARFESCLLFCC
jgi:hypothetical protein